MTNSPIPWVLPLARNSSAVGPLFSGRRETLSFIDQFHNEPVFAEDHSQIQFKVVLRVFAFPVLHHVRRCLIDGHDDLRAIIL
jgi:hypothetical protein